ncbi:MAG: TylF/MycF/NovP-related O-methyltransferase [Stenotrophobium sp.]
MKRLLRRMRGNFARVPRIDVPADMSERDRAIFAQVQPYTMTSVLRIEALANAVRYCLAAGIPGAFAECGVWRGGSVMAMLLVLLEQGVRDRDVYLYDTFEGMTAPTEADVSAYDVPALNAWQSSAKKGERIYDGLFNQQIFNEDDVRKTLLATGYPAERLHFVRGTVEQTIPGTLAGQLALLRLDTDWYESTRHEMTHMYPRLSRGGVLIIDDYGHWLGSRKAVDEYFAGEGVAPVLLQRTDYSGRMAVKP